MRTDAVAVAVGFARTLRAAGLEASPDRVEQFVSSLAVLDAQRRRDVYWAGRLALCADPADLGRYDAAFRAFFEGETTPPPPAARPAPQAVPVPTAVPAAGDDGEQRGPSAVSEASRTEVLRRRDLAELTDEERTEVARLLSLLSLGVESRRTRRWQPAARGAVDRQATVRRLLRHGGEPAALRHRRHRRKPRRVVVLADVSGSMGRYADGLLRFCHAAARRDPVRAEVFTIGTRLTRVTRELAQRDADLAMGSVAEAVPDWRGGTRLGERLKEFLDVWGQRGLARGAVAVVLSDGWEQGDPSLLAEQMARLSRLAHRVIWANPRKARPGFAPLAGGMAAALPYVDDFVEGHSVVALERLARVVAGAGRR